MLTDEELRALIAELEAIVTNHPYPLSPRIQMLRAFLVKFGEMDGLPPELAQKLRRYAPPPAPAAQALRAADAGQVPATVRGYRGRPMTLGAATAAPVRLVARERMRRAAHRSWWRRRALRGQLERRIERKYAADAGAAAGFARSISTYRKVPSRREREQRRTRDPLPAHC